MSEQNGNSLIAVFQQGHPGDVVVVDLGPNATTPVVNDCLDLAGASEVEVTTWAAMMLVGQLVRVTKVANHYQVSELTKNRHGVWSVPKFEVVPIANSEQELVPA